MKSSQLFSFSILSLFLLSSAHASQSTPLSGNNLNAPKAVDIFIASPAQASRIIDVENATDLTITVTNDGGSSATATNVHAELPAAWTDVTQDSSDCVSLPVGNSCELVFSSTSPYAPDEITITGDNVSADLTTYVAFRDGGGLVYSVTEDLVKVADEEDIVSSKAYGFNWVFTFPTGATSINDGESNTSIIATTFGSGGNPYAAGLCHDSTVEGYSDWYLPAVCELSRYDGVGTDPGCDTDNPNVYTALHLNGFGDFQGDSYWSSTYVSAPNIYATTEWTKNFGDKTLYKSGPNNLKYVRCTRSYEP